MSISTLRQFWSVIEGMQTSTLLRLNDAELVHQLLTQLKGETTLSVEEVSGVSHYAHSRLPLIRDLAQSRGA
ncbi:MAG: hypothetical protein ACFE0J_09060 [Elainellaceae cyanobacterium]